MTGNHWNETRAQWHRDYMLSRFGGVSFPTASIPYSAELFGTGEKNKVQRFDAFVEQMRSGTPAGYYIFSEVGPTPAPIESPGMTADERAAKEEAYLAEERARSELNAQVVSLLSIASHWPAALVLGARWMRRPCFWLLHPLPCGTSY